MSKQEHDRSSNGQTPSADPPLADPDPGEPIPELAELSMPASPDFEANVRRRIERRLAAADVVKTPAKVAAALMQHYVTSLAQAVRSLGHHDGKPPDHSTQE